MHNIPKNIALRCIRVYQRTLSPDHGVLAARYPYGFCRYNPSCSEYTYRAIEAYGFVRGFAKGFWRLLRCNPFSAGGFDPIHKTHA